MCQGVQVNHANGATINTDARVSFHYPYTGVTPAMAIPREGKGSDYGIAFLDGDKQPFDGSKTYAITLPPDAPIANFWALTIPGKSWFTILRMYSPLKAWIDQSWRPSEVMLKN